MQNTNQVANTTMKNDEKNVTVEGNDDEGDMIECDDCSYKDKSQTTVNLHRRVHLYKKEKYHCSRCTFTTSTRKLYFKHKKTHVKYSCKKCDFGCNIRDYLRVHMISHNPERNFIWKIWQKDLKHAPSLTKHVNAHIRSYDCDRCDKKYKYPENLNKHKAGTHGVGHVKTHYCEHCTYNSTRGDRVRKHMKSKHPCAWDYQ